MSNYKIGDKVAHPGHGGCTIQEIREREFGGQKAEYFVLVPVTDPRITILAPVENVEKIGLRPVISSEEADRILDSFSLEEEVDWVDDHARRKQKYEETLRSGDLDAIAGMIKELMTRGVDNTLGSSDKQLLPQAQKRLFSEVSLAKEVDFSEIMEMVDLAIGT